ncbi:MAG: ABC transporter ATP-binding protein [Coriobacteriales bacterium]|jgi:ABC-2 type transport system ATP-binding protein|nr:ABC transporter ATP-binding protein [Coriobacteriales bacterium]
MSNALEVKELNKSYPDFKLQDVSFTLPTGYIMGFVGQNGAGKTTTIRCILNMATRKGGEITIFGLDNIKDELAAKQELAVVFDEIFFVDTWRVKEVEKAIRGFYSQWDSGIYNSYLEKFDLSPTKKVKDLSRGMKMKLMLAVAMSHGAKLLILDEPTSGLDPVARDELLDILKDYVAGGEKSVFFSTHITSDLERAADYITLIDHGKIFYTGTKDGLLEHFLIIKGSKEELTDELRKKIIGLAATSSGFNGMIRVGDAKGLPASFSLEQPEIDEILVHISKGGISYE